jgi:heme oxygenase
MIRDRIKTETAQNHQDVEAVGYSEQIMSGKLTLGEYKSLITTNLLLNKAFEKQWASLNFDIPTELMLDQRRKTESLEKDAAALGVTVPVNPEITFPVDTYESFMGSLYVFEGSTLGGAIIHKQLNQNTNLTELDGFHFYSCYGDRLGMMWKVFLDHLSQIQDTAKVDEAIEAAKTTFDTTKDAFVRMSQTAF